MQIVYPDSNWIVGKHALMNLHVLRRNGRTEIDPRSWRIPYQWQGCHYQDNDDQPFLLTLNSGGGFVEGDSAQLFAMMEEKTRALITTTAASKFYKCPKGEISKETIYITVGPQSLLEYYPDEAILFADSRVERRTRIDLDLTSRLFATDVIAAGRIHYGSGEAFKFRSLSSAFEIRINGEITLLDRLIVQSADEAMDLQRLWEGATQMATVVAVSDNFPADIERTIEVSILDGDSTGAGATRMGNMIVCRILAAEAWKCHEAVQKCWTVVRPYLAGKAARPIRKC